MPLGSYLKIPDIDGESLHKLTSHETFELSSGELTLLEALIRADYTFSASAYDFEYIKIKYLTSPDDPIRGDVEYEGPVLDDGKFKPVRPDFGVDDQIAFLKIDGIVSEKDEAALLDLIEANYDGDFKLISAGGETFLKITMDVQTPFDDHTKGPLLTDTPDDFFV